MTKPLLLTVCGSVAAFALALAGCTNSSAPSPEAAALLLTERPAEAVSVTEVRERLDAKEMIDEVAIVGRIGGAEMPFIDDQAAFFVTTSATAPPAEAHDHDHADHDHAAHDHEHAAEDHDHAAHDHEHADAAHGDAHAGAEEGHDHAEEHADHDHADHDHASAEAAAHVHGHDDHGHGHDHAGHDHENCPFCKRGVAGSKSLAVVKLIGKDGQVVAKSAEKLLDLKGNEEVVVVGKPSVDELGNLYIEASRIYVAK